MRRVLCFLLLIVSIQGKDKLPLCGVLTQNGYYDINFIVPESDSTADVNRYRVVNSETLVPPLETVSGWWICITEGNIISAPTEDTYGEIEIESYKTDQTNGERGQE